ncbi:adenylate kinase isoenzyme 1-like [Apis mellifera caucasica]|uniref:Adenylate kinase isoenzyme 1-like n=1 Tax=Apis mellifera TaxID=7460 RepID=A0A7M7SP28_APIME|nr:adenylate kinase isoenzyme 1-like [Apis mellifera]KAG6795348.1 adenylate kinase isoenzyme 1-like [Apis mellifera caucasica]|eukprot:XP_026297839.1 adenylate kinase isoenzyme 1-like [Apis mellifera]
MVIKRNRNFKIVKKSQTIDSMGNYMRPTDPLSLSLPKGINVDTTPIKRSKLPIIFIIGGPGSGKRTITTHVAEKYGFERIISTDIIRNEVSKRSDKAYALARYLSRGQLVPEDVLVELIAIRMLENIHKKKGFFISGFPRDKKQGKVFDKEIRKPDLVILLHVRNSVMTDREMAKSVKATERVSVTFDYIKNRIKDYHRRNKSILRHYRKVLVIIDAEPEIMVVVENACAVIDNFLKKSFGESYVSMPSTSK